MTFRFYQSVRWLSKITVACFMHVVYLCPGVSGVCSEMEYLYSLQFLIVYVEIIIFCGA